MGSQWRHAGLFLLLLGLNGMLSPLYSVNQNILMVKGDSGTILKLEIVRRSIMILVLLVTLQFNVYVFTAGLSFYTFILLFLNLYYCGKPINYSVKEQLKDLLPIYLKQILSVVICLLVAYCMRDANLYIRFATVALLSILLSYLSFRKNAYLRDVLKMLPGIKTFIH